MPAANAAPPPRHAGAAAERLEITLREVRKIAWHEDLPREEFLRRLAEIGKTEAEYFETLRRAREAFDDDAPPPPEGKLTDPESFGWAPDAPASQRGD